MTLLTPTLAGTKTRIRPVEKTDMPLFVRWFTDPEILHWLASSERPPFTLEALEKDWDEIQTDASQRDWIIETLDGKPIGNVGLHRIDTGHGNCELFITIGEKDLQGQGYGADALRLLLVASFEELGLRRVALRVDADNARAIRCYENVGFVREGVLREHRLRHGQPLDMVYMAILKNEWESRQ